MIVVVDYKAGNLTSVKLAFAALGVDATVTSDPDAVRSADRVVFPGVGAAASMMAALASLKLDAALRDVARSGRPLLGICLGAQVMLDFSEEDGGTPMLGLIPGRVPRFRPADRRDKVPEIGWNQVCVVRPHPVFDGIASGSEFYFVHSYYPAPKAPADVIGATDYAGVTFAAAFGKGNLVATQFHPEKSGRVGLKLLSNFLKWEPAQC